MAARLRRAATLLCIAETVRQQMRARGLTPPIIHRASLEPDTIMFGAASLVVDAFLREPPTAEN